MLRTDTWILPSGGHWWSWESSFDRLIDRGARWSSRLTDRREWEERRQVQWEEPALVRTLAVQRRGEEWQELKGKVQILTCREQCWADLSFLPVARFCSTVSDSGIICLFFFLRIMMKHLFFYPVELRTLFSVTWLSLPSSLGVSFSIGLP